MCMFSQTDYNQLLFLIPILKAFQNLSDNTILSVSNYYSQGV